MEESNPRRSVLTVARVGAVLVDLESGITLGAYSPPPNSERREDEDDAGQTDLPSVAVNPKSTRNK